jgi:hypothetical protein
VASKNRIVIRSEFPAVKRAAWETVQKARETWLEVGAKEAQEKVDSQAATRGYNLSIGIGKERLGFQSARIFTTAHSVRWGDDPFWERFFEYGTLTIPAMPFVRPAARKANKAFLLEMGTKLEGNIRRKAYVPPR